MSITHKHKVNIMAQYAKEKNDTGSVEVQCAIFTERIKSLTLHLNANHKDFSSRRGLLILVSRRRKLLVYLKRKSVHRYLTLINKLGIRK